MAAVENPKFEELCRLCAIKTTMDLAINIFENESTIRQISKKICTCLPIKVHETDDLPKMICKNCLYKLELFCDFRERSAQTERLLVDLYNELNKTRAENDQEQTCLVPIDHNELIMMQHNQLLNDDNLQNVSKIDLTHLDQREGMNVEHEIILTHHNVDMNSHSLDSIDLTNQDLSKHSFKTEESSVHSNQDPQFREDNLNLMQQHQLMSDQFRLQHLHINMGDNSGNDVQLKNNEITHDLRQQNLKYNLPDKSEYEDPKLGDNNSHLVDSHLNNIQLHNSYSKEIKIEMEQLEHEDSNSAHSQSLDSIDLNNHDLTNQDLSNHSFKIEESIMVDSSTHSIQDPQITENNLNLMQQHQLSSDQFRLQHLHINMGEDNSGNDVQLTNNEIKHDLHHQNQKCNLPDESEYEDPKLEENNSHPVDSHLNSIQLHNSYSKEINTEMEQLKHEDSNSAHSLLVDEQLNNSVSNSISDKQVYTMNMENSESLVYLSSNKDCLYCNICGKSYEQKSKFEMHCETHFCTVCLAVFTNVDVLNSHRKEAHAACVEDPKPVKTRLKRATVPVRDENGLKTDSNSDDSEVECDNSQIEDEKELDDPGNPAESDINNKRRKWSPKVCKECGKTCKTNCKLAEHMRTHTGEKPYKCKSCEKAFRSKIGLAQHEATHTGQYVYSCPTCGKGFQCKSYLKAHQRVHSDIKAYHCTTCGQNFKTKQSLLDHTNRHLGVKPYMCDICGRSFLTKGLCKAHQKVHSGLDDGKYSCKISLVTWQFLLSDST